MITIIGYEKDHKGFEYKSYDKGSWRITLGWFSITCFPHITEVKFFELVKQEAVKYAVTEKSN